jgi:hypothetical protein
MVACGFVVVEGGEGEGIGDGVEMGMWRQHGRTSCWCRPGCGMMWYEGPLLARSCGLGAGMRVQLLNRGGK